MFRAIDLVAMNQWTLSLSLLTMLSIDCWASAGHGNEGCSGLEESLKACMDQRVRLFFLSRSIIGIRLHLTDYFSLFFSSHLTERSNGQEQRSQLPPDENVPQGLRASQERRSSGLGALKFFEFLISLKVSSHIYWSFIFWDGFQVSVKNERSEENHSVTQVYDYC